MTVRDANGLLAAVEKLPFFLTVVVFNITRYIKGLNTLLQKWSLDIVQGMEMFDDVRSLRKLGMMLKISIMYDLQQLVI